MPDKAWLIAVLLLLSPIVPAMLMIVSPAWTPVAALVAVVMMALAGSMAVA